MRLPNRRARLTRPQDASRRGFTLIELMITLTVLAVVMIVLTTVMFTAARSKTSTANRLESSQSGRVAVDMLARDLRSAGYGADLDYTASPQPPFAYVDSMEILINGNFQPYPDALHQAPLAYDPAGSPRPIKLNGTSWQPPVKYRTGAEIVRWTLDANNDGAVTNADRATPTGLIASTTVNPDDYVLIRQVYGDSVGNVAGANGGTSESVALVRKPGETGIPPMFTVYLQGIADPWNWANGPVPASRLRDIERVEVRVVSPSAKPDWRGNYSESTLSTEIYSIRNVPNFGVKLFAVDGYVFEDKNANNVRDGVDVGITGATVTLGGILTTTTNSNGYYVLNATAGTYVLRHTPPPGYGVRSNPDSFTVTVGPATSRSFADTLVQGGMVTVTTWNDQDRDGVIDGGEPVMPGVFLTLGPTGETFLTNSSGVANVFARVGTYSITATPPDSCIATTVNPVTGVMTNGGTASVQIGFDQSAMATISGTVYQDKNSDAIQNGTDNGIQNVWVGVTSNGGAQVHAYTHTDAGGHYSLQVPANTPPGLVPYSIEIIPLNGFYPTTSTRIPGIYVAAGAVLASQDFGLNSFTRIVLTANRVLSLASGDLMEKDWNGNQTDQAHADADLILGADAAGTDQISVWFNGYDSSTLFSATRDYSRTAPNAVQAIAAAPLSIDPWPFQDRIDIVTGTKYAAAGNFFYWQNQSTSGNEGYLPNSYTTAYKTADNGDVNAVLTGAFWGGSGIDLVVGTKSTTAGRGTFEVWQSNDAANPVFTRLETYPPSGPIPSGILGEVNAMGLQDFRNAGLKDLVVGTRTGTYNGQLMIFSGNAPGSASVFSMSQNITLPTGAVTCLAIGDVTGDGKKDIVVGMQTGFSSGAIQLYRNISTSSLNFVADAAITTTGFPLCMALADFGGLSGVDLAVGFRSDETSYGGGCLLYYLDSHTLTPNGIDPSGGTVTNMVPALTYTNFNYGVRPAIPGPPFLTDLAAGVKSGPSSGALIVFIR